MKYRVKVKSTKYRKAGRSWFRLRRFGLRKDRFGAYTGTIRGRRKLDRLAAYCDRKRLFFRIDNEYGKRGGVYRTIFFRTHRPVFFGCYFCAYCGRLLTKRAVTVDHLYPVGTAYRDPEMQKQLRSLHISGINDPDNLVAACRKCNQEKGKKMGAWIRRGRIGRHQWIWLLRWTLRLMIAAVFIAAVFYLFE